MNYHDSRLGTQPRMFDPDNTALMFVDFTRSFVKAGLSTSLYPEYKKVLHNAAYLSEKVKEFYPQIPQIWISNPAYDEHNFDQQTQRYSLPSTIARGDVIPNLIIDAPESYDHIVVRSGINVFENGQECDTGKLLDDVLQERGVSNILFFGTTMSSVMMETELAARAKGYHGFAITEASTGHEVDQNVTYKDYEVNRLNCIDLPAVCRDLGLSVPPRNFTPKIKDVLTHDEKVKIAAELCSAFNENYNPARFELIAKKMSDVDLLGYASQTIPKGQMRFSSMLGLANATASATTMFIPGMQIASLCFGAAAGTSFLKARSEARYNGRIEEAFDRQMLALPNPEIRHLNRQ